MDTKPEATNKSLVTEIRVRDPKAVSSEQKTCRRSKIKTALGHVLDADGGKGGKPV
jgi:hypothetical protein